MPLPASRLGAFLSELRRRRVFRVALVYAGVSWVLLQVASVTVPALHLPAWSMTLLVVLALFGFPVALVLSWAYEVTPGGVVRATAVLDVPGGPPAAPAPEPAASRPARVRSAPERSVAVLPFVNMSSDPEQEYFSDGITEELLHALAQVPELRVAARTSSFAFKGRNADIREIGEKLGVGAVLEGSVRKGGDRIRLTAQLIQAEDGYHLWSKTYDRELEDVFAVQEEISRSIAEALQLTLVGGAAARLVKAPTASFEAYELYLKGRYHFHKWDESSLRKAVGYFERALEKDPDYALAHAGLADAHVGLMNFVPPKESLPRARAAAQRALELDSTLAEPFASVGIVKVFHDRDWEGAERAFGRALELNPNEATASAFAVVPLLAQGRLEEALRMAERAQRLDPLSLVTNGWRCVMLYFLRRYEEAAARIREFLAVDGSDYPELWGYLGMALLRAGQHEEGVQALRAAAEQSDRSLMALAYLARGLALAGDRDEALGLLAEIDERARDEYVSPSFVAAVHVALGDTAAALDHLEGAYEKSDMELAFLRVHPDFADLRAEPRFIRLVEKLGLAAPPPEAARG